MAHLKVKVAMQCNVDTLTNEYGDCGGIGDDVPVGEVGEPGRPPWHLVAVTAVAVDVIILFTALRGAGAPAGRLHPVRAVPH